MKNAFMKGEEVSEMYILFGYLFFCATTSLDKAKTKKPFQISLKQLSESSPWGNRTPLSRMKILRPNR